MFDSPELTYADYKMRELERARVIGGRAVNRSPEFVGPEPPRFTKQKSDDKSNAGEGINWLEILLMALVGGDWDGGSDS